MNVIFTNSFDLKKYIQEKKLVIVFAVYLILLAIAVAHHEPWMDEAQAWLLAKDLGVKELLVKYLRYEGSPGLWHLILMIPAKAGLPYFSINIVSALFSAAGVWLFIRYAPFPLLIKILYPFSFFVFYQYGVVARSYCLIAPVLFLIAINYKQKLQRPYLFILLLCVLANISAHTFLIAGSIGFVHFLDLYENRKTLEKRLRVHNIIALGILAITALLVIYIIKTPPDHIYAESVNFNIDHFIYITKKMIGGSLVTDEFSFFSSFTQFVSFVIVVITVIWLLRNKLSLLYLLPLMLLSTLFAIKYRNYWHEGVVFLLWVFVLWISYDKYKSGPRLPLARTLLACFALVLIVQVYWCVCSVSYDLTHNYSGSYSLAKYIKRKGWENKKIYVSGWRCISVLPYFSKNIFYNLNNGSSHRFWNWSIYNTTSIGASQEVLDTIEYEQPDVVIFSSDHIPSQYKIELADYKADAFFIGYLCWKTGLIEPECYLVFTKKPEVLIQPPKTPATNSMRSPF